ncbi:MAG: DUF4231 domain-containing protein [Planctomycetes bacterium]|nr:DUF4231 domain-containing protein [Planctomycetota bacterium]
MEQELFEKYLKERYEKEIDWYDKTSIKNKRFYKFFQWGALIISPIVVVLVAFLPEEIKWLTATIAAILAIITAALKAFKYQENWLTFRTIAESLKKEKYFYEAELNDYSDSSDKEALFVERVEALISKENSLWISTHTQKNEDENGTEKNKN